MKKRHKIGVNDTCPCWSGKKYKKCCLGVVDWPAILASGEGHIRYMSARGRNILFTEAIFEALQFDNETVPDLAKYKRAFTSEAVRRIHEAVLDLWPPNTELDKVLEKDATPISGFYIGDYESEYLERSIVRHCLYADKIILADPFLHPYVMAPEFNPLLNPAQHRAQTLKNVNRFFRFLPWIDAGLVVFTQTPADLNRELAWQSMERAENYSSDPKIIEAMEKTTKSMMERHFEKSARHYLLYSAPDSYIRQTFRENLSKKSTITEDEFLEYVHNQRETDPDFLEPIDAPGKGQVYLTSAGGTIDIARLTAEMIGSYLFTDLYARWEMLKKDRESLTAESKVWSPFAKAVQEADFSFLNELNLAIALRLRSEGRLEGIRSVLREAWKADLTSDEFDETNAIYLAENLKESIGAAEAEWEKIRAELSKYGAAEIVAGALASGPLITSGHAVWLGGAAIAGTVGHALHTSIRKRGFEKRFPASFFMDLTDAD